MSLSFGFSPLLLALCLAAAAGFTYWSYRGTVPRVSGAKRAVLIGLRTLALFIVLILLFEPVLRHVDREEKPPVMAVLIDDSQSLSLYGGESDTSAAGMRRHVRATLDELGDNMPEGDLRFYSFSEATRGLSTVDSVSFTGARTDISQALDHVRDDLKDSNLRGVLLLSDGQYNTGRNPLYVAERYPVPIHTVVVGDTTVRRDIQIRRVTTNDIGYVNTTLPVQVGLRAEGFSGEQVNVTLAHDGQVLSSSRVRIPEGTAEVPIDLQFEPETEGLHRMTVTVTRLNGETTYRNNQESFAVRVLRSKRRILLLAPAPGPDVAAIRQLLGGDTSSELSPFVQKAAGSFYEGSPPANLDTFDIIVLAGYPGRHADRALVRRIAEAAEGGTPLFFLLSRLTDLQAVKQEFAEVLPLVPDAIRPGFLDASFVPTPAGLQHPILHAGGASASVWQRLPPLQYSQTRWTTSPDARVLARVEVRGVALDDPMFAIRSRAGARSAAFLADGTWRWKNLPEDLDAAAPLWPDLVEATIQWLGTREDDRPVRVQPVRDLFGGDETVLFTGQVYDESMKPVEEASVQVEVTAPDGANYPYVMDPIGGGRYTLDLGSLPDGTYNYAARAQRDDVTLGDDSGSFAVGSLTLEFKETRANAALLRQIAQRSGGSFLTDPDMDSFGSRLAASGLFQSVVVEQQRDQELWHLYIFLSLVIGLLTVEWFLRKRSGMV